MKKVLMVLAFACATLFLAQCKKEIIENTGGMPSGEMIDVSLIAQNGDGTKTDIQGLNVSWELGDTLCVVGATDGMLGYISAQNNGTIAYFSGSIKKSVTSNQVFHFYYVGKKANKKFPIGISEYTYIISNQTGSIDDIEDNLHLMHGVGSNTINPGDVNLGTITMKNMMSIVDVSFSRTDGRTLTNSVRCKCGFSSMKFDPKKGIFDNKGDAVEGVVRTSSEITLNNITTSKGAVANYYMAVIPGTQTFEFIQGVSGKRFSHDFAVNTIYNHKDIVMERLPYIPSEFTINSNGDKVMFASGNLQWTSTGTHKVADNGTGDGTCPGTWRIADNQYDVIGSANINISSTYTGWIDLFGYGTSGYNSKYPYQSSKTDSDYASGSIYGTNYDWGVYNAISNGGNAPGMWRVLKASKDVGNDEWVGLRSRTTFFKDNKGKTYNDANHCWALAIVSDNGSSFRGILLLPDVFTEPSGVTISFGHSGWGAASNLSKSQLESTEEAGAVFFPRPGYRSGSVYSAATDDGYNYYWSSFDKSAWYFRNNDIYFHTKGGNEGYAVRLVKDVVNGGTASANDLESDTW